LNNVMKIRYTYDAQGNRIGQVVEKSTPDGVTRGYTWYVRDGQGNVMGVYRALPDTITNLSNYPLILSERHIYGSSRLGVTSSPTEVDNGNAGPSTMAFYNLNLFYRGYREYELSNHLGNVLTVISDKKLGVYSGGVGSLIDYYKPHILSAQDYYPFGMVSRAALNPTGQNYRYGFNGKEQDNDVKGYGNQQDYGMRIYDPRLGRFLSVDPLAPQYPWYTPYQFAGNMPTSSIDLDGAEDYNVNVALDDKGHYMSHGAPEFRAGYFQKWLNEEFGVNTNKYYYVIALRGSKEIKVENGKSNIIGAWNVGSYANVEKFINDERYRNEVMGAPDVVQKEQQERAEWLGEYNANLRAALGAKYVLDNKQTKQQTPISSTTPNALTNKQAAAANNKNTAGAGANTAGQKITAKETWMPKEGGAMGYTITDGRINLSGRAVTNGKFDFVVTQEGQLVIGSKHYALSNGAASVQAAGTLKIFKGKVTEINNNSGHYKPTPAETSNFGTILKKAGVDVSGTKVNTLNKDGIKIGTTTL
jgi:RHS repeat-associated protein